MDAGISLTLRIGQRVRHRQDFKGRRVIGVIQHLGLTDGALYAEIGLDEPLVIDGLKDSPPINLYRQNAPAHELTPFDERDEQIAEMLEALRAAERLLDSVAFVSQEGDTAAPLELLRAAIAKATGSQP